MKKASSEFHSDYWVDEFYSSKNPERVKTIENLVNTVSEDPEGSKYVQSMMDSKEFIKPQTVPFIYYVPMDKTLEGRVLHLKFKTPSLAYKHKKLPLLLGVTYDLSKEGDVVSIDYVDTYPPDIRQILSYGDTVTRMEKNEKQKLKDLLIDGVISYRSQNKKGANGWLSDYLKSEKDFTLMGFALHHTYINIDPHYGDTKPLWVHPWGTPVLLYKHKRLPLYMEVGPSIRLDENIQGDKDMIGFTG